MPECINDGERCIDDQFPQTIISHVRISFGRRDRIRLNTTSGTDHREDDDDHHKQHLGGIVYQRPGSLLLFLFDEFRSAIQHLHDDDEYHDQEEYEPEVTYHHRQHRGIIGQSEFMGGGSFQSVAEINEISRFQHQSDTVEQVEDGLEDELVSRSFPPGIGYDMTCNEEQIDVQDGGDIEPQTIPHDRQKIFGSQLWKQVAVKKKEDDPANCIQEHQNTQSPEQHTDMKPLMALQHAVKLQVFYQHCHHLPLW